MSSLAPRESYQPFQLHSLCRHWKHSAVSFGISFVMQKGLEHNSEICSLAPLRAATVRTAGCSTPFCWLPCPAQTPPRLRPPPHASTVYLLMFSRLVFHRVIVPEITALSPPSLCPESAGRFQYWLSMLLFTWSLFYLIFYLWLKV